MFQMDMTDDSYYPIYYEKLLDDGRTLCLVFDDDYRLRMVYMMPGYALQNMAEFDALPIAELEHRGFRRI